METKFNFKSAICTSRSQSERLLALGLKKETADMMYHSYGFIIDEFGNKERKFRLPTIRDTKDYEGKYDIPAWSLHRLIEIVAQTQYPYYVISKELPIYDALCERIEWLIKEGYFNKEYLV